MKSVEAISNGAVCPPNVFRNQLEWDALFSQHISPHQLVFYPHILSRPEGPTTLEFFNLPGLIDEVVLKRLLGVGGAQQIGLARCGLMGCLVVNGRALELHRYWILSALRHIWHIKKGPVGYIHVAVRIRGLYGGLRLGAAGDVVLVEAGLEEAFFEKPIFEDAVPVETVQL